MSELEGTPQLSKAVTVDEKRELVRGTASCCTGNRMDPASVRDEGSAPWLWRKDKKAV